MHLSPTFLLLCSWWDLSVPQGHHAPPTSVFTPTKWFDYFLHWTSTPLLGCNLNMISLFLKLHISTAPCTSSWHSHLWLVCVIMLEGKLHEERDCIFFLSLLEPRIKFLATSCSITYHQQSDLRGCPTAVDGFQSRRPCAQRQPISTGFPKLPLTLLKVWGGWP